jgi:hypothetical protein
MTAWKPEVTSKSVLWLMHTDGRHKSALSLGYVQG